MVVGFLNLIFGVSTDYELGLAILIADSKSRYIWFEILQVKKKKRKKDERLQIKFVILLINDP